MRKVGSDRHCSQVSRAIVASLLVTTLWTAGGAQPTLAGRGVKPSLSGAEAIYYQGTKEFMQSKQRGGGNYNWSDNGCSVPAAVRITTPATNFAKIYFLNQCKQHDFGYANFGRLDPTESRRKSVDDHFYSRMKARCLDKEITTNLSFGPGGLVIACRSAAEAFYRGVRTFGKRYFSQ